MTLLNRGLCKLLAGYLNQSVLPEGFGRIQSLTVDPAREEAEAVLELAGEAERVQVALGYRWVRSEEPPRVLVRSCRCSRPWMEALAQVYLVGRSWPLPAKVLPWITPLLGSQDP